MIENSEAVLRFAPSPNGELHLGHAYSALFTADMARRLGGRCLLRIEDIDLIRCRPEYEAQIYDDLAWLGLTSETPVRRQSEHFDDYRAALDQLDALGVIYPCFATRREIAEAARGYDPDGAPLYPGLWRDAPSAEVERRMAANEPYALRLNSIRARERAGALYWRSFKLVDGELKATRLEAQPERWGDAVLARKDTPTSYHLSVVVDDALQGVTHVTRGADLLAATDLHVLLQALLGLPTPFYAHHELITLDGRKLAKSAGDKSLRALREAGVTPADILSFIHSADKLVR
ncbi:MAG: tRNA glutamyl-Q(34) synthetase GluQRS [Hyphomicrobiales bacterium]|nr:tRNA glutamyl-Q(34) synthetase GluQRS [Hyphomicrobiales bacterium]